MHDPAERADPVAAAVADAAHLLPDQGPIEVFVHHNTLHGLQHLPFEEALREASRLHGADGLLDEARYRRLIAEGRIRDADLRAVLREEFPDDGRALLAGPTAGELRLLALRHGLPRHDALSLDWALAEAREHLRLRDDLPPGTRRALVAAQGAWALRAADALAGDGALVDDLGVGAGGLRRLVESRDERALAGSLWATVLASVEAPGDAPEADVLDRAGRDRTHLEALALAVPEDPRQLVNAELVPRCAAFLDEGFAAEAMPGREGGFLRVFEDAVLTGGGAMVWTRGLRDRVGRDRAAGLDAFGVIAARLAELGVDPAHARDYLARRMLLLPGWAGMFHRLERHPEEVRGAPRAVRLADWLAVALTLDACALEHLAAEHLGDRGPLAGLVARLRRDAPRRPRGDHGRRALALAVSSLCQLAGLDSGRLGRAAVAELAALVRGVDPWRSRLILQRALERRWVTEVLSAVVANGRRARREAPGRPGLQVMTCIDDREESLRRHLEAEGPAVETFGAAGFFGLAVSFRGLDAAGAVPLCPVVAEPRHRVVERPRPGHAPLAERRLRRRGRWARLRHALARWSSHPAGAALLAPTLGLASLALVALRVLSPRAADGAARALARALLPDAPTELAALRDDGDHDGGFTLDEAVDRVAALLEGVGMRERFAPVVAILGHGSSSANNPHRSAYQCGACGGRQGGASARLFARLANREDVRAALLARGVAIPRDTVFVGGEHDTSTDGVALAPVEERPPGSWDPALVELARGRVERAAAWSARERCRRFEHAPRLPTPEEALRHVRARAAADAEPRPELGHATNAACVVGRRALTRDVFLDRRALLVSYDPGADADGAALARVMGAAVPVCAGINLEYYFSTVDNDRLGSGTKLPHNPVAGLGVMEGSSGDLRTGLPRQMVEVHEPVRLLTVVDAPVERLGRVLEGDPSLAELARNGWILLAAVDPATGSPWLYAPARGFEPFAAEPDAVPRAGRAEEHYDGRIEHLPVALLGAA